VTQHYFNQEYYRTILFGLLSTHLHRFQVIECDVYTSIVNDSLYALCS